MQWSATGIYGAAPTHLWLAGDWVALDHEVCVKVDRMQDVVMPRSLGVQPGTS